MNFLLPVPLSTLKRLAFIRPDGNWADRKNRLNTQSRQLLSLAAFVAYLGFLNVLVAHSHPVMLVFCHLLINRDIGLWLEESFPRTESSVTLQEERYGQGILCFWNLLLFVCFCLFVLCVCVFVVCLISINPRNVKLRKDSTGFLFFSQYPVWRHLGGMPKYSFNNGITPIGNGRSGYKALFNLWRIGWLFGRMSVWLADYPLIV